MKRHTRAKLASLLRAYPAMRNALKNLNEQTDAEIEALSLLQARSEEGTQTEQQAIDEHMFIIEGMTAKKRLLEARVRAIERSLRALSEYDRALLSAFYFEPYEKDKPSILMDRFSYEKSQLYYRRGVAIDRFGENYCGDTEPWSGF